MSHKVSTTKLAATDDKLAAKFVIGCSDDDFQDGADDDEPMHVVPPDGGWGWMVVAASFLCNVVVDGIIFTSGMLFPSLRKEFGATNAQVAWISSLLGGFYLLVGPFVSSLANAFGFRTVCILGAVIGSISCGVSYYATSIYYLYVSFGIVTGMGFGLIYVPAVIATGFYFEKRRAFATGIAVCGSGIGTFIYAPLITNLVQTLGDNWNVVFLVYSGSILACAIFGLAFRPLSPTTGKMVRTTEPEADGTPLLIRIKHARDKEMAQCASALSIASAYSRSNSKATMDDMFNNTNGQLKVPSAALVARTLLDRHSIPANATKRLSFPGVAATTTIIEEDDADHTKPVQNGMPKSDSQRLLDGNKNFTRPARNSLAVPGTGRRSSGQGRCPRIESAPHLTDMNLHRRPSRQLIMETSRPFYRDDVFYSGSLARIPQYKSSETMSQYHASVTRLPSDLLDDIDGNKEPKGGCVPAAGHVLKKIFDFSLLSSVTFIVLSITGFMALFSLFVPFSFLPSYAESIGIDASDTGFLMSLIGICNTVGRLIAGWISDHPKVDALLVNNLALIIGGIATILLPFIKDLSLLYCYAVVFGFCVAAFASLRSILLVELLGLEKLTNAFGLLLLFQGIAGTFGAPIAGMFVDATQSYSISFYVFGSVFALSGVLCIPLRRIKKWEDERLDRKLRNAKYGVE